MKRTLLLLAVLVGASLLLTVLPTITPTLGGSQQKAIRYISSKNSPVKITKVKLGERVLDLGRAFDAENEWVRQLSLEIKNVSGRDTRHGKVELKSPSDDSEMNLIVVPLEYGEAPQDGETEVPGNLLRPGESATLSVQDWSVEFLRRNIREKGSGKAAHMNRAMPFVSQVWFDADTGWSGDTIFTRDPADRTRWHPAGQAEAAPPSDGSAGLLPDHKHSPSLRGVLSFRGLLTSIFVPSGRSRSTTASPVGATGTATSSATARRSPGAAGPDGGRRAYDVFLVAAP